MDLEYTLGRMAECMKDSTKTIRNTGMVSIHGLISKSMLVGGLMESNMVLEYLFQKMERRSMVFGNKVRN